MKIEHNSRLEFYRKPFGAVECGSKVHLRLSAEGVGIPSAVRVVYVIDGGDEFHADMSYELSINESSVYSVTVKMPETAGLVWYWFEIVKNYDQIIYYGNNDQSLGGIGKVYDKRPEKSFQITIYNEYFKTPDWFKTSVAYQIFPDRFCNGNEDGSFLGNRTDIIKRNWNDLPFYKAEQFGGEYKSNDFFGGNLKGITKKLDYLKDLGISVIYLNPIFKAYSNHKYDTGSYEEIDPMFGTEADFKELCNEAKKRGIRIILDGVFNHTGSDSQYFNKNGSYTSIGAYQSQDSPYYNWYRFSQWPENYESWWGMQTLPQVEEQNEDYRKYILSDKNSIIKKWLRNGASGWRLDVADELPDSFIKELRENAKKEKNDAVIIGEVWEDASNKVAYGERRKYFLGDGLDSVMNYPMRDAIIDYVLGRINASSFDNILMNLKENYPKAAYYSLLNMLSGHDIERIMTLMSGAPSRHEVDRDYQARHEVNGSMVGIARARAIAALGLQMTLPGVPCVYYGDEIGMTGYGDPFCRSTYPWDNINKFDDGTLFNSYKRLIALRNEHEVLSTGEFKTVYKTGNIYGYIRYNENEKLIIAVNTSNSHEEIRIDAARFDVKKLKCIFGNQEELFSQDGIFYTGLHPNAIKVYITEE